MKTRSTPALFLILLLLATSQAFAASGSQGKLEHRDSRIAVVPDYGLEVEVWTNKGPDARYCVGEPIEIFFRTNVDAYVAILDTDTRGRVQKIFPNRYDSEHFARAGRTYSLPIDGYRLLVEGPPGRETLRAVAAESRRSLRRATREILRAHERYPASFDRDSNRRHGDRRVHSSRDGDLRSQHDRGLQHSPGDLQSHQDKIVVVPDDVAFDAISHRVRDGRSCQRRQGYRPWWR